MNETFKAVALSVIADLAREAVTAGRQGTELTLDEQQRLFNATMAATELGVTTAEIAATLREAWKDVPK